MDGHMTLNESTSAVPDKSILATFRTYREAQRAVDELSDHKFPVEHVQIVARGLNMVEQVTGRLNWGKALLSGLGSGALIGALIGVFFGIFDWFAPVISALWLSLNGAIIGALVGGVFGLISYWSQRGERDFRSRNTMQAERYEVLVDDSVLMRAQRILEDSSRVQLNARRVSPSVQQPELGTV